MRWSVMQKSSFTIFYVKVTVGACSVENLITMFKVKITAKIQNVSECLSGWYLMNHRTFCNQTWYGGATSWARVSCGKKIVCSLQGQGHSESSYDQNMTVSTVPSELLILRQPNLLLFYNSHAVKSSIPLCSLLTPLISSVAFCVQKSYRIILIVSRLLWELSFTLAQLSCKYFITIPVVCLAKRQVFRAPLTTNENSHRRWKKKTIRFTDSLVLTNHRGCGPIQLIEHSVLSLSFMQPNIPTGSDPFWQLTSPCTL